MRSQARPSEISEAASTRSEVTMAIRFVNLPVIPIACGSQLAVTFQGVPVVVECVSTPTGPGAPTASPSSTRTAGGIEDPPPAPELRPAPRPGGGFTNYLRFGGIDVPGGPPTIDIAQVLEEVGDTAVDLAQPTFGEPIVVSVRRADFHMQ